MKKSILIAVIMMAVSIGCSSEKKNAQIDQTKENVTSIELSAEEKAMYMEKAKQMVQMTMKTLGSNLMSALKQEGTQYAVNFCKLNADPLVDSLQKAHNVKIRRATLKPRNQVNQADSLEEAVIVAFMEKIKQGESKLKPILSKTSSGNVHFYAPIKIPAPVCLKCHGKLGETLAEDDYKIIKELYPEDKAIGYSKNELRGIWNIAFSNQEVN